MIAIGLLLAIAGPSGACQPVDGMRILGRHLAAADAVFAGLGPDVFIGYAPSPGVRRVFTPLELERIARAHGVTVAVPSDLCFEWPLSVIEPERLIAAMRRNPELSEAKIEIVQSDPRPGPRGEIVFPPGGRVGSPTTSAVDGIIWRGYIKYDTSRRFDTWAKVKIAIASTRVVVSRAIPAGELISEDDLRMEDFHGMLPPHTAIVRVEEIIGQTTRRSIRAGEAIVRGMLESPKEVRKGDSVEITLNGNNLRFRAEGYAETAGRRGETILVRNVTSGKRLRARVDAPGRVTVAQEGPVPEKTSK